MTVRDFITRHEGRKDKPYKCPAGFKTIGAGWNMEANPLPGDIRDYLRAHGRILDEHIDRLLTLSINTATSDCKRLFPLFESFTDNRKTALIDFVFQLGQGGAGRFVRMIAAVNTGRWEDAAREMKDSNYYRQVPGRAKEVIELIGEG